VQEGLDEQCIFQTHYTLGILSHGELRRHSMDPCHAGITSYRHGVGRRSSASATYSSAAGSESISGTLTTLAGSAAEGNSLAAFASAAAATRAHSSGQATTAEEPSLAGRNVYECGPTDRGTVIGDMSRAVLVGTITGYDRASIAAATNTPRAIKSDNRGSQRADLKTTCSPAVLCESGMALTRLT
jgi:hypothetical protein